jgi:manganese-dependent inorganic pyrophosphatase
LAMLKAGADLSQKTISDLISIDAKEFQMGSYKVEIAQVNAVDVNDVLSRQDELEAALNKIIIDKKLDLFIFVVTDILNNDSVAIALGRVTHAVEQAYDIKLENNLAILKGVVSRKLQIVPVITDILNKL